jgi:pimeloyl-ACP methyl ester carboxylesterase
MKAHINGMTMGYDDRGSGLPIVFLHAFPLNRSMWIGQALSLSRRFRIITLDLRGHGESGGSLESFSLDQAADDVRALLDFLAIQQAVFVGLSMGGYILLALHRLHADCIKGMVLADTKAQADTAEAKHGRVQMAETASRRGPTAIADIMIPRLLSPATIQTKQELVNDVRTMIEATSVSAITADLTAMAQRWDSTSVLPTIACPTTIIVGELDIATPVADAALLAGSIPAAQLSVIPEAAHLSNLEQPQAFNALIGSFAAQFAAR